MFRTCGGTRQSPINIETGNVKTEYWRPFSLKNYDLKPSQMRVKNNGHSAQVEMDNNVAPRVLQGGLKGEYIFAQFHFHWGGESSKGSEHTIDGVRYPMELHLVHYNAKYNSLGEAVEKPDGLAVLGVLYEISSTDNPALTPLVNTLKNISEAGFFSEVPSTYPLRAFLPSDLETFYRYEGSLTTPTCNEVVTWTVFSKAVPVSETQMSEFRALKMKQGGNIINNFRPPQPLGNRKVFRSSTSAENAGEATSMKKLGMAMYFMSTMAVLMMNM
ncbi:carbonic anhydrase 2-like [Oratosquilla oratoria]|uniref:carbonic anhydrase 2-like n=1 Tax=Oratosquilla oratoria TaxID=337810 RepID=UPI003F75815D